MAAPGGWRWFRISPGPALLLSLAVAAAAADCPDHCYTTSCHKNGDCYSCDDGYWGKTCAATCPEHCAFSRCYMSSGLCSGTYCDNDRYWGTRCENECPEHCAFGRCNKGNGLCSGSYCENDNYWGDKCENRCPWHCENGCHKSSGKCHGCDDGWQGAYCSEPTETSEMCKDVVNKVANHYTVGSGCEEGCGEVTGEECAAELLVGAEVPVIGWAADVGVAAFCGVEMLSCTKLCGAATEKITEGFIGDFEQKACTSMYTLGHLTPFGQTKPPENPAAIEPPAFPSEFSGDMTTHFGSNYTLTHSVRYSAAKGEYHSKEHLSDAARGLSRTFGSHRFCGKGQYAYVNLTLGSWSSNNYQQCMLPKNYLYGRIVQNVYRGWFTYTETLANGNVRWTGPSSLAKYASIEYLTDASNTPLWIALNLYNSTVAQNITFGKLSPF